MNKSEQINELAAALSKAQGEIKGALKDSANPFFKSKYADLASVWDACRDHLAKNGLSVIQMPETSDTGGIAVETLLAHSGGQWISSRFVVPIAKPDAQSIGSAITYARRYALAAMVGVAPEDDDGNAATKAAPVKEAKGIQKGEGSHSATDGSIEALTPEDQIKARSIANRIVDLFVAEDYESAYSTWHTCGDNEFKMAVWEMLKPQSSIRSTLTRMGKEKALVAK